MFSKIFNFTVLTTLLFYFMLTAACYSGTGRSDLDNILNKGELRHLGIPYANFIKGNGEGLDVELAKGFANYLGVKYIFVTSTWDNAFADLTGARYKVAGKSIKIVGKSDIKADILSTGLTKLGWREKIVSFSEDLFPTQVWCIARSDSPVTPIKSTGNIKEDIKKVKKLVLNKKILCKRGTCLTPELYGITDNIAEIKDFKGNLNDLAPALIKGEAELSMLDVPDALIALEKWPGKLKIIGPLSEMQTMAAAFRKSSPELRRKFNDYLLGIQKSGEYQQLVKKYYPAVYKYFSSFFEVNKNTQ